MTSHAPYEGDAHLSDENAAFLAALCKQYRENYCLTLEEAGRRAATSLDAWWAAEHMVGAGNRVHPTSPIRRIINLVLRVSPVCHKAESSQFPPKIGASHVEEKEETSRGIGATHPLG